MRKSNEISIIRRLKKLRYNSYREYLLSEHWREFKKRFFENKKEKWERMKKRYGMIVCEFCKKPGRLAVHHWTYKRLGREYLSDVSLICEICHSKIHAIRKGSLYERTERVSLNRTAVTLIQNV